MTGSGQFTKPGKTKTPIISELGGIDRLTGSQNKTYIEVVASVGEYNPCAKKDKTFRAYSICAT